MSAASTKGLAKPELATDRVLWHRVWEPVITLLVSLQLDTEALLAFAGM